MRYATLRRMKVTVYPPDENGGRAVRADGILVGRALDLAGIVDLVRWAGLDDADEELVAGAAWIVWRGGGPDMWVH